jgi:hypothetical protein
MTLVWLGHERAAASGRWKAVGSLHESDILDGHTMVNGHGFRQVAPALLAVCRSL